MKGKEMKRNNLDKSSTRPYKTSETPRFISRIATCFNGKDLLDSIDGICGASNRMENMQEVHLYSYLLGGYPSIHGLSTYIEYCANK